MKRALCAAILTFEAVVLGLTTPVLIAVQDVGTAKGLWIGLGLTFVCLLTAGLLRRPWAYWVGWLVQLAAIALGFEISVMFVLGLIFLVLWLTAFLLGERIDADRRNARPADPEPTAVPTPARWDHELVCSEETQRPFVQASVADLRTPRNLALVAGAVLVGGLLLLDATARPVGAFLIFCAVVFPVVAVAVQRQAWRSFLRPGRTFRTAFEPARLVVEVDGVLAEVAYDDITAVARARGLVTVEQQEGQSLQLPEPVFPDSRVQELSGRH